MALPLAATPGTMAEIMDLGAIPDLEDKIKMILAQWVEIIHLIMEIMAAKEMADLEGDSGEVSEGETGAVGAAVAVVVIIKANEPDDTKMIICLITCEKY